MKKQLHALQSGVWIALLVGCLPLGLSALPSIAESSADGGSHDGISCVLCHFTASEATSPSGLSGTGQCFSCHSADEEHGVVDLGFHTQRNQDCSRCHSFHSPDEIRVPGGRISRTAIQEAGTGHCRSCHGTAGRLADLSDSHRTAANLYHGDLNALADLSPSQGCLLCHDSQSRSAWQKSFPEAVTTFNRHSTHPLGVANRATRAANAFLIRGDSDRNLPLFEDRIECQTCHLITARSEHLVAPVSENQGLCLGCHLRNGIERVDPSTVTAAVVAH